MTVPDSYLKVVTMAMMKFIKASAFHSVLLLATLSLLIAGVKAGPAVPAASYEAYQAYLQGLSTQQLARLNQANIQRVCPRPAFSICDKQTFVCNDDQDCGPLEICCPGNCGYTCLYSPEKAAAIEMASDAAARQAVIAGENKPVVKAEVKAGPAVPAASHEAYQAYLQDLSPQQLARPNQANIQRGCPGPAFSFCGKAVRCVDDRECGPREMCCPGNCGASVCVFSPDKAAAIEMASAAAAREAVIAGENKPVVKGHYHGTQ